MSIGLKIKQLREKQGWTCKEFAEKIQVKEKKLQKWEENKTLPNILALKKMALVLEVPIDELYLCLEEISFTENEKKCYEDIANYKRISLLSYVLLLLSIFFIAFAFTELRYIDKSVNNIHTTVFMFGGLSSFLFALYLEISQFIRLITFKNIKEYRLEYKKAASTYLTIFFVLVALVIVLAVIFASV